MGRVAGRHHITLADGVNRLARVSRGAGVWDVSDRREFERVWQIPAFSSVAKQVEWDDRMPHGVAHAETNDNHPGYASLNL